MNCWSGRERTCTIGGGVTRIRHENEPLFPVREVIRQRALRNGQFTPSEGVIEPEPPPTVPNPFEQRIATCVSFELHFIVVGSSGEQGFGSYTQVPPNRVRVEVALGVETGDVGSFDEEVVPGFELCAGAGDVCPPPDEPGVAYPSGVVYPPDDLGVA